MRRRQGPGYGDRRKAMLEDIATLTGGRPFLKTWRSARKHSAGSAGPGQEGQDRQGQHDHHRGYGKKAAIQARIQSIQRELDKSTSDYDREKLGRAHCKLSGGWPRSTSGPPPKAK